MEDKSSIKAGENMPAHLHKVQYQEQRKQKRNEYFHIRSNKFMKAILYGY